MNTTTPIWVCFICGEDLGDHATKASGDCVQCGRVVCEDHFAHYDDSTGFVTCPPCAAAKEPTP